MLGPSGGRVVSAGAGGRVRRWQADGTGEPVVLEGHQGAVRAASFSPSGDRVVSAGLDGRVRLWRLSGVALQKVIRDATPLCLDTDFRQRYLGEAKKVAERKYEECEREQGRMP